VAIDRQVPGLAVGQRRAAGAGHPVGEGDPPAGHLGDPHGDDHLLVVTGRLPVAAGEAGDHEQRALGLPVGVGDADGACEGAAGGLEPHRVDAVVDHAHLVGLGVADPDRDGEELVHAAILGHGGRVRVVV